MFGLGFGSFMNGFERTYQQPGLANNSTPPIQTVSAEPASAPLPSNAASPTTAPATAPAAAGINRSRFADELRDNPSLRRKIMAISAGENLDPAANQAVLESMMNRAAMSGTSLAQQARLHKSSGIDEKGYYAGYNPSALSKPKTLSMIETNLDKVLSGSNVSNYATDNASGDLAARERASGAFKYQSHFNGETFFSPGTAGGSGSRSMSAYNKWLKNVGDPGAVAVATNQPTSNRMSDDEIRGMYPNAPHFDSSSVTVSKAPGIASAGVSGGDEAFSPGITGRRPYSNPFGGMKAPNISVKIAQAPAAAAPNIVDPDTGVVVEGNPLPMNWQA